MHYTLITLPGALKVLWAQRPSCGFQPGSWAAPGGHHNETGQHGGHLAPKTPQEETATYSDPLTPRWTGAGPCCTDVLGVQHFPQELLEDSAACWSLMASPRDVLQPQSEASDHLISLAWKPSSGKS